MKRLAWGMLLSSWACVGCLGTGASKPVTPPPPPPKAVKVNPEEVTPANARKQAELLSRELQQAQTESKDPTQVEKTAAPASARRGQDN